MYSLVVLLKLLYVVQTMLVLLIFYYALPKLFAMNLNLSSVQMTNALWPWKHVVLLLYVQRLDLINVLVVNVPWFASSVLRT